MKEKFPISDKTYTRQEIDNVRPLHEFELKSAKASQIMPKRQPWLWEGYIPLETSTLIAGKGGAGKSQFLTWFASMISNGSEFSINSINHKVPQGSVIFLSAEDHQEYSIIPRLMAVGANLDKIEVIESAVCKNSTANERFVSLDRDLMLIENKIEEIGDVKLIIYDPITAYIGDIRENKSSEVRSLILKLNRLAEKYHLANILNTHTRKSMGSENFSSASDEVMGSSAWTNTPRKIFTVNKHHEDEELFVISNPKNNFKKSEALAYRIVPHQFTHNNETIETSRIEWQLGKIEITADEAANKKLYEERLDIDIAKEFIMTTLSFGSKEYSRIREDAFRQGITEITLKRARQKLTREGTNIVMSPSQMDRRKMIWFIGNDQK